MSEIIINLETANPFFRSLLILYFVFNISLLMIDYMEPELKLGTHVQIWTIAPHCCKSKL